ncbi:MAG: OmpA family protein [Rhodobacteraceae bacterium]|nr:OmpA family protein [Paracoccaceae bacterium]
MAQSLMKAGLQALEGAIVALSLAATGAQAHHTMGEAFAHQHNDQKRVITGERYTPTIWVDPDGCEHWVMDDGWEGFMSLKVDRNGLPTCRKSSICATIPGRAFEPHGVWMSHKAKQQVMDFFAGDESAAYKVIGHTDISGNDRNNVRLSKGRANMVATLGQKSGARIVGVDGHGGRHPKVNGHSHENSRIEVYCLR